MYVVVTDKAWRLAQQIVNALTYPTHRRGGVMTCHNPQQMAEELADTLLTGNPSRPPAARAKVTWQRLRKQGDPSWYSAYLRSRHWKQFRKQMIEKAGYKCSQCSRVDPHRDRKRGSRMNVHHKTYERVGAERPSDVVVLCWICHKAEHSTKEKMDVK